LDSLLLIHRIQHLANRGNGQPDHADRQRLKL
jgi:hypothetical protein